MPTLKATEVTSPTSASPQPQAVEESEVASIIAAAEFLADKTNDPAFIERVRTAVETGDALTATTALADAFIRVLDCSLDSNEIGSVEGCMQELLLWVKKECKMNDVLVNKLANDLCAGTSRGDLRLKCMGLLYNAVDQDDSNKRYQLLNLTISLTTSVNLVPLIQNTVLPQVDRFLKQWQATAKQKRETYARCYEALKSVGDLEGAFAFNVKMLELYNHADAAERASVADAAVDAIVQAVRLPKLYRFDTLLELEVVKEFEKADGDKSALYKLIKIFVQDDLESFTEFYNENAAFLDKYEIDKDIAVDKMRLLTFASLGIESQDLSYDAIAKALQIPDELVEEWVIRAIGSGLVDAKINQLKSSVAIYRSTQRMFTREEWQPLSERINIWKENVSDLLAALREIRSVAEQRLDAVA